MVTVFRDIEQVIYSQLLSAIGVHVCSSENFYRITDTAVLSCMKLTSSQNVFADTHKIYTLLL